MLHSCLQLLLLSSIVTSFSVDRPRIRIRTSSQERQISLGSIDVEHPDSAIDEGFSIPWILDAASITASSNYPWTVESLAASAPLLRNQDEIVLVVVESPANLLYSGGPLAQGVGLWFANSTEQLLGLTDQKIHFVSSNPSFSTVSAAAFLSDVESLGPCTALLFSSENSVTVQAYMDLQTEIQELRDIVKPQKRRGASPNARKGVSRKQRTKVQKRTSKLVEKTTMMVGKQKRTGYNVTTDAAILRQRLEECGTCLVANITSGLAQVKSILEERVTEDETDVSSRTTIHGAVLSEQVLTITRRSNISTSLRMVVLSDTHGFESHFRKYGNDTSGSFVKLPDADVLIHCGDFYGPGRSLNAFLAAQTHIPDHIVVRGNHDPLQFSFSNAQYITKRQTITLKDGTILEARPFLRSRSPQATLPDNCDVLMTHEPPFGICDQTYRMERVGSLSLRHAVESSPVPPALWLCGHIHEGRGAVWHSFSSSSSSTAVVNAANANSGKARRVTTGPVVIDLVPAL